MTSSTRGNVRGHMGRKPSARKSKASPAVSAKADVGLRAEAKLIHSTKHKKLEVIPPDVTRAKAVALLDLFAPLTQASGLVGDFLTQKREIMRLRHETLMEIAVRARDRMRPVSVQKPMTAKFLLPFLEQA